MKQVLIFLSLAAMLLMQACAKTPYIENVTVQDITAAGGDPTIKLQVSVNPQGFQLPITGLIPIEDPKNQGTVYGSIALWNGTNGTIVFEGDVDLKTVAGLSSSAMNATLPNGVPVSSEITLPSGVSALELPIKDNPIKLYLALGPDAFMLGAAFPISELDELGAGMLIDGFRIALPTLFIPFTLPKDVTGSVGLFTSPTAGENGFAFFLELAGLLNEAGINWLNPATPAAPAAPVAAVAQKTTFKSVAPTGVKGWINQLKIHHFMTFTLPPKAMHIAPKKVK